MQPACHSGGFVITPDAVASGIAAYYSSPAHFVAWFSRLPDPPFGHVVRIYPDLSHGARQICLLSLTRTCVSFRFFSVSKATSRMQAQTLPRSQQRGRYCHATSSLSLPPLDLLASMPDSSEEDGDKPALTPQRRIPAQNIRQWAQHQQAEATILNSRKEAQEAPPYAAHPCQSHRPDLCSYR